MILNILLVIIGIICTIMMGIAVVKCNADPDNDEEFVIKIAMIFFVFALLTILASFDLWV
ncbi:MAG: hypothetical protein K2Y14_01260 [Burkholderiales bacterium]|nr:hypothetical protein [Burkholderiales bacterium]